MSLALGSLRPLSSATSVFRRSPMRARGLLLAYSWMATLLGEQDVDMHVMLQQPVWLPPTAETPIGLLQQDG